MQLNTRLVLSRCHLRENNKHDRTHARITIQNTLIRDVAGERWPAASAMKCPCVSMREPQHTIPCVSMRANRILPLGQLGCAFLLFFLAQSLFERDFAATNTLNCLISTPYTLLFIGYLIGLTQRRNAVTSLLVTERMGRNVAVFMLPFSSGVPFLAF